MKIKPAAKRGEVVMELRSRDEQLPAQGLQDADKKWWPFQLNNILVPIDFSDFSVRALEYALPLARSFGAKIIVFHAISPVCYPDGVVMPEGENLNARLEQEAASMLDSLGREKIDPDIASKKLTSIGIPWQEIVATARITHSDLIILATHGYTGLKHVLMGSTAERIVRHASCPVLGVRAREHTRK